MPYFLSRQDVYSILQRELPPGVYPDGGPASGFYSTSDNDSIAQVVANCYLNQQIIYNNFFPQTMQVAPANAEFINQWEIAWFGVVQNTSLTIAQRIENILGKIQSQPNLSVANMEAIVANILGNDNFEIIEWGNYTGSWMIGYSALGEDTYLAMSPGYNVFGANICPCPGGFGGNNCPPPNGLTLQQIAYAQQQAYTYQVIITGSATAAQLAAINEQLTAAEPARSTHVITVENYLITDSGQPLVTDSGQYILI